MANFIKIDKTVKPTIIAEVEGISEYTIDEKAAAEIEKTATIAILT